MTTKILPTAAARIYELVKQGTPPHIAAQIVWAEEKRKNA